MSQPTPPASTAEPDPFRYGWRYVRRTRDDGTEETVTQPLTLLDVLHPREGDVIPENTRHERLRRHFHNVFESRLSRQPTLMSLSDCLIDWDHEDLRPHSPDLIVLERDQPWPWGSWGTLHVEGEGARPLLAVEIVSPSTRVNDVEAKVEHYHRAGVPLYVIVDEEEEDGPLTLVGYRRGADEYEPVALDERGHLMLERFGLSLAVAGDRVAIFDAATGKELGDYTAVTAALEAEVRAREEAERRAAEEAKARADAERRAAEATQAREAAVRNAQQAALAKVAAEDARREAEERAREAAAARASAEKARAESEQQQAATLARMQELEAEVQRLRGA